MKKSIKTILEKTNYDLRIYLDGNNRIEAWYKSNGKRAIVANPLSKEDLAIVLRHPKTKKQFKENINEKNESVLYTGR